MGIKVISENTQERNEETKRIFEEIRPYLEEGHNYTESLMLAGITTYRQVTQRAWYKELKAYGEELGYIEVKGEYKKRVVNP